MGDGPAVACTRRGASTALSRCLSFSPPTPLWVANKPAVYRPPKARGGNAPKWKLHDDPKPAAAASAAADPNKPSKSQLKKQKKKEKEEREKAEKVGMPRVGACAECSVCRLSAS